MVDAPPFPGSWKNGRISSGRTSRWESSGISAVGVFAGAGFGASPGGGAGISGSAGGTSTGTAVPGARGAADLAEAAFVAAISSMTAGNGGAVGAGRVERSGGGGAWAKRKGGGPTASRYGIDDPDPLREGPEDREDALLGLGVTSDASAGTKINAMQRRYLLAENHQAAVLLDFIQIAVPG
jgi:hypothetical protein